MQTTNRFRCKLVKGTSRQIKRGLSASLAGVQNSYSNAVPSVTDFNLLAADWVVVRVSTCVTGVAVKEDYRYSNDQLIVGAGLATSTQTNCIERDITAVSAIEKTVVVAA